MNTLYDTNAEKAVLAATLALRGENLDELSESLAVQPNDFCQEFNAAIYTAMLALWKEGKPVDSVNVRSYLRAHRANSDEICRYVTGLLGLKDPQAARNWESWAQTVKDLSNRRTGKRYLLEQIARLEDVGQPFDTIASDVSDKLPKMALDLADNSKIETMVDVMGDFLDGLGTKRRGVPSGIYSLDRLLGKFCAGNLILVSARPSVGKTATLIQLFLNAARTGHKVLFFSLEMLRDEIMIRIAANLANKDSREFEAEGEAMTLEKRILIAATVGNAQWLSDNTMILSNEDMPIGIAEIRRFIRIYKKVLGDVEAVYIDYVDLLRDVTKGKAKGADTNHLLGVCTKALKEIAKSENVSVILATQLSRASEKREDKHPTLTDLRDSGELEQDADVVIGLYRPDYGKHDAPPQIGPGPLEMLVLKQRKGPIGTAFTRYDRATGRIEEMTSELVKRIKDADDETQAKKAVEKRKEEMTLGKQLPGFNKLPKAKQKQLTAEAAADPWGEAIPF